MMLTPCFLITPFRHVATRFSLLSPPIFSRAARHFHYFTLTPPLLPYADFRFDVLIAAASAAMFDDADIIAATFSPFRRHAYAATPADDAATCSMLMLLRHMPPRRMLFA